MRLATSFFLLASAALAVAQFQINTPVGVSQCVNSQLSWTGGTGPFTIDVMPGGQPGASPLETLGPLTAPPVTWLCKLNATSTFFLRLRDTTNGMLAESGTVTVQGGTTSCLGATSSSSGAAPPATGAGTTPAGTTTAASPGTTSAAATTSAASANTKPTTTSSSASKPANGTTTTTGGAGQLQAPVALAGVAALAMAVFA